MDYAIIERLEELVEKISNCYTSIPADILNELNEITKNDWTEGEYIEFCAEYWSRSDLEETVYALLHDGNYPDNIEKTIYLWKTEKRMEEDDFHTWCHLGRALSNQDDEDFVNCFEDLPFKQFYEWLRSYYSDWNLEEVPDDEDIKSGDFEANFECDDAQEYGVHKYVWMQVEEKKLIELNCCNLSEKERQDILAFAAQFNLHVFERDD